MKTILTLVMTTVLTLSVQAKVGLQKPVKPTGACIFGEDIGEIEEKSRFELKSDVISTFKIARSMEGTVDTEGKPPMVNVSIIKDKKTKKVYHMNTTFRHIDDGDNTWGWIEEVNGAEREDSGVENEGRVVAVIGDSSIDSCIVRE